MGKRFKRQYVEKHKQALGDQIEDPESYGVRTKPTKKQRNQQHPESDEEVVPGAITDRILKEARAQQEEVDEETRSTTAAAIKSIPIHSDEDSDFEENISDAGSDWELDGDDEEFEEISPEDEAALAAFMAPNAEDYRQRTLSDLILEKIRERQGEAGLSAIPRDEDEQVLPSGLSPKVIEVYQGVGALLSRYTSGKVPKAFKVIPSLSNWEEILFITNPEEWSPHAVNQATRMFVSNLNSRMAQRFLSLVLLPAVRFDIKEHKRLHFALFQALKKATYKAGAFYKGILIPLCSSGTCTLREAVIVSSVLRRSSIPVLHSAAALLRLAELPYCGTTSFFMRVLLDKKYALPYRVIDALVDHFTSFANEERQLPVVWHQGLLCFIQRYKAEIRKEDKRALRALCKRQNHYLMTPEILRELDASTSRGEAGVTSVAMAVDVRVGKHVVEDPRDLAPIIIME